MKKLPFRKRERGQSLVELAITLTVLLMLVAGIVDLGMLIFSHISLRDAVQEGASYAGIHPTDCAGIIARVRDHTNTPVDFDNPARIQVDVVVNGANCSMPPPPSICPGDRITVSVVYKDFKITTPFIGTIVGSQTIDLHAKVEGTVLVDVYDSCP